MDKIVLCGKKPLYGRIDVAGMKNAALPILFATVLVGGRFTIGNLPDVSDIRQTLEILKRLGATVLPDAEHNLTVIDTTVLDSDISLSLELASKMRASYYLVGAALGRCGRAHVGYPGGCDFGTRPIDQHLKCFRALGATVTQDEGYITACANHGMKGTHVYFDVVSVGATVNAILAATRAEGMTVLENVAKEPHIVNLTEFLNFCGAHISGAGTDTIKIRGEKNLHGCDYDVIPDMIEAGTYMIAAATAGGDVIINNVIPKHLESVTAKLIEMGATVLVNDESVEVIRDPEKPLVHVMVKALPYPGFPTDMQPQMCALMCTAQGTSYISEGVWDTRFRYVDGLVRMGAQIVVQGKMAVVEGGRRLSGTLVSAPDLRGGAAMILAGLAAEGVTTIEKIHLIERGYDNIVGKLAGLGAEIKRVSFPD